MLLYLTDDFLISKVYNFEFYETRGKIHCYYFKMFVNSAKTAIFLTKKKSIIFVVSLWINCVLIEIEE